MSASEQFSTSYFDTLTFHFPSLEREEESVPGETLHIRIIEVNRQHFVDILREPDLPHHGEGETASEAVNDLCDLLLVSWKMLREEPELSTPLKRQKQRLDKLFSLFLESSRVRQKGRIPAPGYHINARL